MSEPAFLLERACLEVSGNELISNLDWVVRGHAVTALVGPVGTGKSLLLRALSGGALPEGCRIRGSWRHKGAILSSGRIAEGIAWAPQVAGARRTAPHRDIADTVTQAFEEGAETLLLDEVDAGLSDANRTVLKGRLRAHTLRGSAVVVTHDLTFARAVADDVALLCAGSLVAQARVEDFFLRPQNELAARFVRDGNCWPRPADPPPLPSHFHWIVPGRLAGMGRPGLLGPVEAEVAAVVGVGVGLFVTLTEEPLPPGVAPPGVATRHFPIADMGIPAIGPTASLCRQIERSMASGVPVAVHCHAGLGRTGTVLAALLVWMGEAPAAAIERIRAIVPGYIQTRTQAAFVVRFAEAVSPGRK